MTSSSNPIVITFGTGVCSPDCLSGEVSWQPSPEVQQKLAELSPEVQEHVVTTLKTVVHGFAKLAGALASLAQHGPMVFEAGMAITLEDLANCLYTAGELESLGPIVSLLLDPEPTSQ